MAVKTNKSTTGSSYHGVLIITTPNKLKEILGSPTLIDNTGENKTNMEYICETRDGILFTIYDYYQNGPLNMEYNYGFHIGGFSKADTEKAKAELELMIDVISPDFY